MVFIYMWLTYFCNGQLSVFSTHTFSNILAFWGHLASFLRQQFLDYYFYIYIYYFKPVLCYIFHLTSSIFVLSIKCLLIVINPFFF